MRRGRVQGVVQVEKPLSVDQNLLGLSDPELIKRPSISAIDAAFGSGFNSFDTITAPNQHAFSPVFASILDQQISQTFLRQDSPGHQRPASGQFSSDWGTNPYNQVPPSKERNISTQIQNSTSYFQNASPIISPSIVAANRSPSFNAGSNSFTPSRDITPQSRNSFTNSQATYQNDNPSLSSSNSGSGRMPWNGMGTSFTANPMNVSNTSNGFQSNLNQYSHNANNSNFANQTQQPIYLQTQSNFQTPVPPNSYPLNLSLPPPKPPRQNARIVGDSPSIDPFQAIAVQSKSEKNFELERGADSFLKGLSSKKL